MASRTLDKLSPEQRKRLQTLEADFQLDQLTVSFSLEARDLHGCKRWTSFTATASKREGSWTPEEAKIAGLLLSKRVAVTTYHDAVLRKILSPSQASEEVKTLVANYDSSIAKLLEDET